MIRQPQTGFHNDGTVDVQCHCGAEIVNVPPARLLDGGSCGRSGCTPGRAPGELVSKKAGRPKGSKSRRDADRLSRGELPASWVIDTPPVGSFDECGVPVRDEDRPK